MNNFNKADAYRILMIESEKQLFKQLMYMAVDLIKSNSEGDKTTLFEFYQRERKPDSCYL